MQVIKEEANSYRVLVHTGKTFTIVRIPKEAFTKDETGVETTYAIANEHAVTKILNAIHEKHSKTRTIDEAGPSQPKKPKISGLEIEDDTGPKKKQAASISNPLQRIQYNKQRRQQVNLVLASLPAGASIDERLSKFEEAEQAGTKPLNDIPDVEKAYLNRTFLPMMEDWPELYAEANLQLNPPPTNALPRGVPRFDPLFLVPALAGYSPAKALAGQAMTSYDHNLVTWMEQVIATAVGFAPYMTISFPEESSFPSKEITDADGKKMVNANYQTEMVAFAENIKSQMKDWRKAQQLAEKSSRGFNILYEYLNRARKLNFKYEFQRNSPWKRLGMLQTRRFGTYLFDNDEPKAQAELKKHSELYYKRRSGITGIPNVQLQRRDRYFLADPRVLDGGPHPTKNRGGGGGYANQGNGKGFRPNYSRGGGQNKGPNFQTGRGRGRGGFQNNKTQQWANPENEEQNLTQQKPPQRGSGNQQRGRGQRGRGNRGGY